MTDPASQDLAGEAPPLAMPGTIPVQYATGQTVMPGKARHPAIAFIIASLIYGSVMLLLTFVFFYMVLTAGEPARLLKSFNLYDYFIGECLAQMALLVMMMAGISGLSMYKPWSRPVLFIYASLMIVLEILDIVTSMEVRTKVEAWRGMPLSPLELSRVAAIAIFGYVIVFGHALWAVNTMTSPPVKRAFDEHLQPSA